MVSERTVHIGVGLAYLVPIIRRIGVGEYRRQEARKNGCSPYGWFLSESEFRTVADEWIREHDARKAAKRKEPRQRTKCYATRPPPKSKRQRALETWRNEWSDPFSVRKTKEACWAFAVRFVYGTEAKIHQMPSEELPPRPSRESVIAEMATARIDKDGEGETDAEREARLNSEALAALRPPSRGLGARRSS